MISYLCRYCPSLSVCVLHCPTDVGWWGVWVLVWIIPPCMGLAVDEAYGECWVCTSHEYHFFKEKWCASRCATSKLWLNSSASEWKNNNKQRNFLLKKFSTDFTSKFVFCGVLVMVYHRELITPVFAIKVRFAIDDSLPLWVLSDYWAPVCSTTWLTWVG